MCLWLDGLVINSPVSWMMLGAMSFLWFKICFKATGRDFRTVYRGVEILRSVIKCMVVGCLLEGLIESLRAALDIVWMGCSFGC